MVRRVHSISRVDSPFCKPSGMGLSECLVPTSGEDDSTQRRHLPSKRSTVKGHSTGSRGRWLVKKVRQLCGLTILP